MKNSALRNVTAIISKIIEVILWVVGAMVLIASIVLTVSRSAINEAAESGYLDEANVTAQNGVSAEWFLEAMKNGTAGLAIVPFAIIIALTALIFRNLYMILRKSNTDSPFSEVNIKRIRNIGFLALALPVAKILIQLVYVVALGYPDAFFSVSVSDVVLGLVALCLSRYFAYGAKLEQDVDGLL